MSKPRDFRFVVNEYKDRTNKISSTLHMGKCGYAGRGIKWTGYSNVEELPKVDKMCRGCRPNYKFGTLDYDWKIFEKMGKER